MRLRNLLLMEPSGLKSIHLCREKRGLPKGETYATPAFDQPGSLRACRDANFICIRNANCETNYARRQ